MESIVPQKLHVFFSDEVFPGGGGVFEKMARGGNLSAGEEKRFERCVVWLMNNDPDFEDYCHELDLEGVLQVAPNLMIKELEKEFGYSQNELEWADEERYPEEDDPNGDPIDVDGERDVEWELGDRGQQCVSEYEQGVHDRSVVFPEFIELAGPDGHRDLWDLCGDVLEEPLESEEGDCFVFTERLIEQREDIEHLITHADVFKLHFVWNYGARSCADHLGVPIEVVEDAIFRLYETLELELGREAEFVS